MRMTLSAIKADVGSIGGHTRPTDEMLDRVRSDVQSAIARGLLIDGFVFHVGDDIAIVMTHTREARMIRRFINSRGTASLQPLP